MKRFSQQAFINLLFLIGLTLITASTIAAYREAQELLTATKWVNHTHNVIETADKSLLALIKAGSTVYNAIISKSPPAENFQADLDESLERLANTS